MKTRFGKSTDFFFKSLLLPIFLLFVSTAQGQSLSVDYLSYIETYKEIATIEVPRNITYYSFLNLAKIDQNNPSGHNGYHCTGTQTGKNYYIYVEAEDRMGNIISKTDKVLGQVYVMVNGYFSLSN